MDSFKVAIYADNVKDLPSMSNEQYRVVADFITMICAYDTMYDDKEEIDPVLVSSNLVWLTASMTSR